MLFTSFIRIAIKIAVAVTAAATHPARSKDVASAWATISWISGRKDDTLPMDVRINSTSYVNGTIWWVMCTAQSKSSWLKFTSAASGPESLLDKIILRLPWTIAEHDATPTK